MLEWNIIIGIFLAIPLFIFCVLFHEFLHWIVLKCYGYKGKLVFRTEGIWIFKGIGIKPIGVKENIICAKESVVVLMFPFLFWWIWIFPLAVIDLSVSIDVVILALILSFLAGLIDIKQTIGIKKWWLKPVVK